MLQAGTVPEWTIGWRMHRALVHAGLSVEAIADDMGVSRSTVSRWLNDHGAPPRAAFVKQWALRTGVPYGWLCDGQVPAAARTSGSSSQGSNLGSLPALRSAA